MFPFAKSIIQNRIIYNYFFESSSSSKYAGPTVTIIKYHKWTKKSFRFQHNCYLYFTHPSQLLVLLNKYYVSCFLFLEFSQFNSHTRLSF